MTKDETKEFREVWLELEDIITNIDPYFHPCSQFRRPEEAGPAELKLMVQFLRIMVKLLLHDNESMEREQESLKIMIENNRES